MVVYCPLLLVRSKLWNWMWLIWWRGCAWRSLTIYLHLWGILVVNITVVIRKYRHLKGLFCYCSDLCLFILTSLQLPSAPPGGGSYLCACASTSDTEGLQTPSRSFSRALNLNFMNFVHLQYLAHIYRVVDFIVSVPVFVQRNALRRRQAGSGLPQCGLLSWYVMSCFDPISVGLFKYDG